jgi:HK97 gp10 family phage protein
MNRPLVEIEGFEELQARIRNLANDRDKRREVLGLLRQIARPTLQAAKNNVPIANKKHKARGKLINPGNLKKSLGTITGRGDNPTIYVGPRAKGGNDGWYGHFVEYGVNKYAKGFRRRRTQGANNGSALGRTRANPFMQRAYDSTRGGVTADAESKVAAYIQRRIDNLSS